VCKSGKISSLVSSQVGTTSFLSKNIYEWKYSMPSLSSCPHVNYLTVYLKVFLIPYLVFNRPKILLWSLFYFLFRFPLGFSTRWRICLSSSYGDGGGSYAARLVCVWQSVQLVRMATIPPTIRIHDNVRIGWYVNHADSCKMLIHEQYGFSVVIRFYNEYLGVLNPLYKQTQSCADDLHLHEDVFINHNETLDKNFRIKIWEEFGRHILKLKVLQQVNDKTYEKKWNSDLWRDSERYCSQ